MSDPSVAAPPPAAGRAEFLELVQSLDAIVWEMDARTWRFTFVSDRAERLLGYPVRRWYDEPTFWQDVLLDPEDRDWAVDFCVTATNEARDHEFLYRARHADGQVVWLKDLVRVVRDEAGGARLLRGVMIDVTKEQTAEARHGELAGILDAERAAQAALERSQADLRLALAAGRMGTWEWDIAGGIVHWSPEEEGLYGLTPGSFEGTAEAYMRRVHPDDRAEAWRLAEEALARRDEAHHVLHRVIRPDGAVRWLESHGRFVYDADGRPLRLVGVSADVTDRVHYHRLQDRQDEMLAAVDVGAWYCDLPFDELQWDRKVKEHFWLAPDARVTIETFYERIHPEDRDRTRRAIERSIAERTPYDIEYRTVAADDAPEPGAVRWVRAIGYTGYDRAGNPARFDGITVDVTPQKRAAEALAESERRYEYAARATSNAIWDWDLLTDRVRWNPGVHTVFGYDEGGVEETAGWWYEHIHPDDRERVVAGIHAVIDGADGGHGWTDEYRFRRVDGTHATVIDRGYVARDASGRSIRMIGAMEDVTARRIAEAAQREAAAAAERARASLQDVFEQAPAAISVTEGPEHVTVSQNAVSRQMIGGRSLVGQRLIDIMPDAAEQGFLALMNRVYQTGEPFVGSEMPVLFDFDGDGVAEGRYFNVVYQPMRHPDGRSRGVLTHAVEVTEQVRARREVERKAAELARLAAALERSNRDLDQFAYVASHDLKAPLRGIANLTQWIEEDLGERVTGESREHMRLLKGRVQRLEALIDGVLTYSRAGRVRVAPEPVDLGALAREVAELVSPPPGARVEIAPDLPTIVAERVPLQQVLLNLIANGLKFTAAYRPDPVVRVGWRDAGEHVELTVADNGPGIAPEYHDRIWGIFQTLEARDKVEGTGIGLSVVKRIVETRGGRAWLESAPGAGATFHVELPKDARASDVADER